MRRENITAGEAGRVLIRFLENNPLVRAAREPLDRSLEREVDRLCVSIADDPSHLLQLETPQVLSVLNARIAICLANSTSDSDLVLGQVPVGLTDDQKQSVVIGMFVRKVRLPPEWEGQEPGSVRPH